MNYEEDSSHSSWSDLRPNLQRRPKPPFKRTQPESVLHYGQVVIERKSFVFQLRENARGRLLRITEASATRQNCIIIPASGLAEFQLLLNEMSKFANELPVKSATSQ